MSDASTESMQTPRRLPVIMSLLGLAVVAGVITALATCLNAGDHSRALNPLPPGALMAPATYTPPLPPAALTDRVPGDVVFEGSPAPLSTVEIEKAFPNLRFDRPTYIGHHEDGSDRLFVLEQKGVVHIFENRKTIARTTVCLDISAKTRRRNNEEGLLAFAVHPNVADNGYIYVHYSASDPRRGVISRFTLDKETLSIADPDSELVILEQDQPYGNHNGGALEFGPDGYLYITFGDGGLAGDPKDAGQDLATWLGKMLRIDVDRTEGDANYALPQDNPYLTWDGAMPEIWALGLRNLWRFSFDRASGVCIGGDVGQNKWEEINIIHKGCNYGWRVREGKHAYRESEHPLPPYIDPVWEYGRREGVSVTGGHVYRGRNVPDLIGAYVYADYGSGNVWALRYDGNMTTENKRIARVSSVASFGEDRDGELYMCSFDKSIYTFKRRVSRRGDADEKAFPMRLSETGLFKSLSPLTPVSELIPYDVNVPLWSAHAGKHRWIMLPGEETVTFSPDGDYAFPAGTIFVKHFEVEMVEGDPASARPLETRVLLYRPDHGGWEGYTYVWMEDLSDAQLLIGDANMHFAVTDADGKRVDRSWHFPSSSQCMNCHHPSGGYVLGFHTRQLNRDVTYVDADGDAVTENQIAALARIGVFENPPESDPADLPAFASWALEPVTGDEDDPDIDEELLESQVRAYLHSNCAFCHNPMGPANAMIDLRAETDLWGMNAIDVDPMRGIRFPDDKIIKPGAPRESTLYTRMASTDGGWAMPDIGHTAIDVTALSRIAHWIRLLEE